MVHTCWKGVWRGFLSTLLGDAIFYGQTRSPSNNGGRICTTSRRKDYTCTRWVAVYQFLPLSISVCLFAVCICVRSVVLSWNIHDPERHLSEADRDLLSPFLLNSAPNSSVWNRLVRCQLEYSPIDTQWLRNLAVVDVSSTKVVFDDDDANSVRARLRDRKSVV